MKRRRDDMKVFSGNRANRYSLNREFQSSLQRLNKTIPLKREKVQNTIQKLQVKIESVKKSFTPDAFHKVYKLRQELEQSEKHLSDLDNDVACKTRQFQSLVSFNSVEALVFANRLLERPPEVFPVEVDKCLCGKLFVFNATESTNICKTCNVVEPVLFHVDDNSADTLILRLPVSGTAYVPQPEALTRAGLLPVSKKRTGRLSDSVRSVNYRRFLTQFTLDVSDDVLAYVHCLHNRTVHSHSEWLCRSTRFASFLRESQTFSHHNNDVTAITMCFYNGKKKILNERIVNKLVRRFEAYRVAVSDIMPEKESKKCAALEFLTNRFLIMEGEVKLSRSFELPKTRTVLRSVNNRFINVCETLHWKVPRAI